MDNMIIVDIETGGFDVESGIMEVAAIVIENDIVKDSIHIGVVYDEELISNGYGDGYEEISENEECIGKFKDFVSKYNYPIIAHNANFDRKFLVHYGWLDSNYPVYDSMRAIRYENPNLFSYAMEYLLNYYDLDNTQSHTAIKDVYDLYNIIKHVNPSIWIAVGERSNYKKSNSSNYISVEEDVEVVGDLFKDKMIVFTGKGPYTRKDLSTIAMKYGATVLKVVNKKTDILVVGEGAGQKLQKANEIGIEILSIDDFMDMTSAIDVSNNLNNNPLREVQRKKFGYDIENKYFDGDTISLVPMRLKMAEKLASIIEDLGGTPITTFRQKETKLLIYENYGEDFATVKKAKDKNIKTVALHEFNRILVDNNLKDLIYEA